MLERLMAIGTRTAPGYPEYVEKRYVDDPLGILCSLAEDDYGNLLLFQSLTRSVRGSPCDAPAGWGIIGIYVSPDAARTGVGTKSFAASKRAAIEAGLTNIEAIIDKGYLVPQAYYRRIGFETYRHTEAAKCKVWTRKQRLKEPIAPLQSGGSRSQVAQEDREI
jgi:GNAT superfamily N-acetyltransferase